jgi:nascent polypeptide-associated complex subunit alpha
MIPGMNPRKMAQAMKRMGIQQVDIPATEVIIKTPDKELIITDPQVAKVNMMGQETIQVTGEIHERELSTEPEISEDDVKTVVEQAKVSEEEAKKAIEDNKGDLAAAIMSFQTEEKEE